jgi:D-arabinose 1-dehydrogenase-like Zn-dependent alcohol dehydrogenase
VKNFVVGDRVGVGCMVWSCQQCDSCSEGKEQYCENIVLRYNAINVDGSPTFGGYSSLMVCDQRYDT